MKKKKMRIHFVIGWLLVAAAAIFLFPDKNIALQSERPHLGQVSTRTIVAPINFEVPKSEQEIEAEKTRAAEKVNAIFGYNSDETNRVSEDLKLFKFCDTVDEAYDFITSKLDDHTATTTTCKISSTSSIPSRTLL